MTDQYGELIAEARALAAANLGPASKSLYTRLADALESLLADWYDSILKAGALQDERDELAAQIAEAKDVLNPVVEDEPEADVERWADLLGGINLKAVETLSADPAEILRERDAKLRAGVIDWIEKTLPFGSVVAFSARGQFGIEGAEGD